MLVWPRDLPTASIVSRNCTAEEAEDFLFGNATPSYSRVAASQAHADEVEAFLLGRAANRASYLMPNENNPGSREKGASLIHAQRILANQRDDPPALSNAACTPSLEPSLWSYATSPSGGPGSYTPSCSRYSPCSPEARSPNGRHFTWSHSSDCQPSHWSFCCCCCLTLLYLSQESLTLRTSRSRRAPPGDLPKSTSVQCHDCVRCVPGKTMSLLLV